MASKPFPVPKGMPSFWQTAPGHLDNHRSSAALPVESDIVIIGAGYSGASLVTHLLDNQGSQKKTILVLEARQLCSGATGRNGGHLKPDVYNLCSSVSDTHGLEAAVEIAEFELQNVEAVKDYVHSSGAQCDFVMTQAVDVQFSERHDAALKARYEKLSMAGIKATQQAAHFHGRDAEIISGVKGAKGAFKYSAGHLWPYKLIHHMFEQALKHSNVNLQTNSPVIAISQHPDSSGRWRLTTPRGDVLAQQVIVATNAYTAALLPEYQDKIIPYRTLCSRIVTPEDKLPPLLVNSYALRFNEWDYDYLIPRVDGSIIVGGARRTYLEHLQQWYGNVDDSKLMDVGRDYFDGYMQRNFRGWENSGAYTDKVWTGVMGYSADRLPRIGKIPGRQNMFIMGGFTGHGMPQIFLAAKGLSRMVSDDTPFSNTGIPRLFEETEARLQSKQNWLLDLHSGLFPASKL
ncbi:FAD dependent oxidoreductase [Stachybotrys elegans]|uniref:FAD dependent oxidoreductase n=1 Tax=Stachybotrys elegans TaxID=80388 RepID=A0A8K0SJN6_9HYPO|nr:FAD dependent oxidoreductase [Stachybotrys elegans]